MFILYLWGLYASLLFQEDLATSYQY